MPDLSDEERTVRQRAVNFARGSTQLSAGDLNPEVEALNARYIAGERSGDVHVAAVMAHARTLPKGEPVQAYFMSAGDAMKANPGRWPNRPDRAMSSPSGRSGRAGTRW